jgi:hypothetical protein
VPAAYHYHVVAHVTPAEPLPVILKPAFTVDASRAHAATQWLGRLRFT